MLDMINQPNLKAECWADTLAVGDVIAIPENRTGRDGIPYLVLDVVTMLGDRLITLTPGILCRSSGRSGYDIQVSQPGGYRAARLAGATCFLSAERRTVSLARSGPDVIGGRPLGRIQGDAFDRMQAVRARIDAERDIGVERRQRRIRRRRPAVRGADFQVVLRHPRPRLASRRTRSLGA